MHHVQELARTNSPVSAFEAAADAIVGGDMQTLRKLLAEDPRLVHQRSTREHHSTLLHYVSANGVEDFRQKTPKNIVEVANVLLDAGAEMDAESEPMAADRLRSGWWRQAAIRSRPACKSLCSKRCWNGARDSINRRPAETTSPLFTPALRMDNPERPGFSLISARPWTWKAPQRWAASICCGIILRKARHANRIRIEGRLSRHFSTRVETAARRLPSSSSTGAWIQRLATKRVKRLAFGGPGRAY
jgi:hypothetical protein